VWEVETAYSWEGKPCSYEPSRFDENPVRDSVILLVIISRQKIGLSHPDKNEKGYATSFKK